MMISKSQELAVSLLSSIAELYLCKHFREEIEVLREGIKGKISWQRKTVKGDLGQSELLERHKEEQWYCVRQSSEARQSKVCYVST